MGSADLGIRLTERLTKTNQLAGPTMCVEIGARKPPGRERASEPFYRLPSRRILAIEADRDEAERLTSLFVPEDDVDVHFGAVGRERRTARLYVTRHPKCSSLFAPDNAVIARYPGLDVARLLRETEVELADLDSIVGEHRLSRVDLVKMDVQGAEGDVIDGAPLCFRQALVVVAEVAFTAVYRGQPLFGDIAQALARHGMEFYRFLQIGGVARTTTFPAQYQQMWGDALFIRSPETTDVHLAARLAALASLYEAFDVAEIALGRAGLADSLDWFRSELARRPPVQSPSSLKQLSRLVGGAFRRIRLSSRRQ